MKARKQLITVICSHYNAAYKAHEESRQTFIRPLSQKAITYRGAARMVAAENECKPSEVIVTRIEYAVFA